MGGYVATLSCHSPEFGIFNFHQPNLGRTPTDLDEIRQADWKLVRFMNAGPNWG